MQVLLLVSSFISYELGMETVKSIYRELFQYLIKQNKKLVKYSTIIPETVLSTINHVTICSNETRNLTD